MNTMPRGRPKGSKNKPKDPVVSPTEEDFLAPEPVFDNELNDMTERVGRKPKHNFDEDIELLPEVKTKDELSIEEELLEAERRINEPEVPLPPPQYAVKKKKDRHIPTRIKPITRTTRRRSNARA